jgi:hypothetical protein
MKGELDYFDRWLADGELGTKQLGDLVGLLRNLNERTQAEKKKEKVILCLHHHPFIFPHSKLHEDVYEKVCHYLKDGEEFMTKITGLVDILLFGHEHEHMNFSGTPLSKKYKIPNILSCGKSTVASRELHLNRRDMNKEPKPNGPEGLLAWNIQIDDSGNVNVSSLII